jgi:hypothetical protein
MALDPKDGQLMRDAFYDALDKWSNKNKGGFGGSMGAGSAGGAQAAASGTTILGKAASEAGGLIKGLAGGALDLGVKMAKGGLTVTEASKTIGDSLKSAGGAGAVLATSLGKTVGAFGDLINYVEEGLDTFRDLSKTGVTFNNSVVDMQAAAAGSRLTLREFGNLIKENNGNFLALGSSAGKGAKEFARLSKTFFDSGFGDKLTQLGYTSEDLNSLMATQMANMTARELKAKGGDTAQFEATVRLAEEMDAMAKLTGKSRKEQEAALKAGQADGQRMSALQALKNKNIVGAQDAFNAVTTNTVGQFQTLMQDMVTAGRPLTKEMASYYGLLSKETKAAIAEAQEAVTKGDVKAAEEASKRAMALEAKETVTNNARINLGTQGNTIQKKAMEDQMRLGNLIIEKEKELKEKGFTGSPGEILDAARKQLADEIKKEQNVRSAETAGIIEAQNRIKDMGSAIQESIIVPLKDEANKRVLNDFYKTLSNLNQSAAKGGTAGSDKGFAGDVSKTVQPAVEGIKSAIARMMDEKGPDQKFSSEAAKVANQTQADALKKAVTESSRKDVTKKEENDIKALTKSLKTVDGEAVSKKLEEIAKAQGKSSSDVLKEAINKPGGIGNLNKQIGEDAAAKKQLDLSAEAVKKEQAAKAATDMAKSKGRDTTGTSGEAIAKGAGAIGSALGSFTTGTIDLFTVQGDVKINTAKLPGAAEGGVLKGPESGYLAMLHGEETVIPNKDIDTVIKGAISKLPMPKAPGEEKSFADSMAADIRKGMQTVGVNPAMRGNPTGGMDGFDLSSISKDISTTISSVQGGGSTTGKMVQSDDSKAAEKELDTLWKQFGDDWSKRKDQVIEGMAVEDRKFSKVQAAMKADEAAMKIKEDYEKKKAELQKKIDDGIKWEVETKQEAINETEKMLSEELLMLKAQGIEKLAITEFNEEEAKKILAAKEQEARAALDAIHAQGTNMADKPDKNPVGGMSFESMFNPVRTSAQSMMEKFGKENEQKKAEEAKTAADKAAAKPGNAEKKPDSKPAPAANKADSTLNDVVNSLDRLNMMMGQLLSQSEDLGKKQLRASKANSVQP